MIARNGQNPGAARRLGVVIGGSLSRGLDVRLDGSSEASLEDVAVGSFVTIVGRRQRYFAVVTDLELRAVDDSVRHFPPTGLTGSGADGFAAEVMAGNAGVRAVVGNAEHDGAVGFASEQVVGAGDVGRAGQDHTGAFCPGVRGVAGGY